VKTIIDCRGMTCPQPVIETKNALEEGGSNRFGVLVDNEASRLNVERFAKSRGWQTTVEREEGGCYHITLSPGPGGERDREKQEFHAGEFTCETAPAGGGLVYVISADTMGRGDDELGWGLMQTYIQTIREVPPLPAKILFYNSGVKLVAGESGALDALCRLRDQGVEILACGTCLDFYKLKAKIKVGRISNMYDIMSAMNEASRVVSPL